MNFLNNTKIFSSILTFIVPYDTPPNVYSPGEIEKVVDLSVRKCDVDDEIYCIECSMLLNNTKRFLIMGRLKKPIDGETT